MQIFGVLPCHDDSEMRTGLYTPTELELGDIIMADHPKLSRCELCRGIMWMGHDLSQGRYIATYDLRVCYACWVSSSGGWHPRYDSFLLERLRQTGLPIPARNANGWLPRGEPAVNVR